MLIDHQDPLPHRIEHRLEQTAFTGQALYQVRQVDRIQVIQTTEDTIERALLLGQRVRRLEVGGCKKKVETLRKRQAIDIVVLEVGFEIEFNHFHRLAVSIHLPERGPVDQGEVGPGQGCVADCFDALGIETRQ